jgi:rhamnose utilization protein RhaD (predicted bifunctional aldolase and dehydrogenase)
MASGKKKADRESITTELLEISHEFGRRELSILGEGNVSGRLSHDRFLVKASGSSLATLVSKQLTEARFDLLLAALDDHLDDEAIERRLLESRVDPEALKPSVETFFHAYLLTLPGINYVGHTHPIPVNQILCTERGQEFAVERQCPDEIVCCGPTSLLIPYVDPGLALAREIRIRLEQFREQTGRSPRVILLENHGVITIGGSTQAVKVAMLMVVKAAIIYSGARAIGTVRSLAPAEVSRIEGRIDEEYRRKMLKL